VLYIFMALIFFAAGFTQGLTGFGSALVAMPLLVLLIDVKEAVPLCMLNGVIITGFLSLQLRSHLERRKILPLLLGCLPGVGVGVFFLKQADPDLIRSLLGGLIVCHVLFTMARKPKPRPLHPAWAYAAGFGTGAIGAACSAGGPPTIIYTTLAGWSRDQIKATLSGFFLASGLVVAAAHALSGMTTGTVLRYFAVSMVFVLLGVVVGARCSGRLDTARYLQVVRVVLLVIGCMMLFGGGR
jgi:hypothetical protein